MESALESEGGWLEELCLHDGRISKERFAVHDAGDAQRPGFERGARVKLRGVRAVSCRARMTIAIRSYERKQYYSTT